MQICLLTQPGRGDTEPFVALAVRLKNSGHTVTLASRPDLADLAAEHDVEFVPVGNPYQPFIAAADRAGAMGSGHAINKMRFGLRQRSRAASGCPRHRHSPGG
jgi:UDP:flavonoid glycosyltransferase YjiC (YdhE family)